MADTNAASLGVGSLIDNRFEIVSKLGEGGFGVVFKARQLSTGQDVAIKVLHTQHVKGSTVAEKVTERFEREMSVIAQLKHPNIVRLFDSGVMPDGTHYAVIEYVVGEPLSDVLEAESCLKPVEAVRIMSQVLDALACAHEAGVVHRDMKPDNVMLTTTGARRNALVLDFGIAGLSAEDGPKDVKKLTATGQFIGTPQYMAPEQLNGSATTTQTDIYAWGLVFIEALTGRTTIDAASLAGVLMKQLAPDPVPIPEAILGSPLGPVVRKAVAKSLKERFATAKDALDALEAVPLDQMPKDFPIENTDEEGAFFETCDVTDDDISRSRETGAGPSPGPGTSSKPDTKEGEELALDPQDIAPPSQPAPAVGKETRQAISAASGGNTRLLAMVGALFALVLLGGIVLIVLAGGDDADASKAKEAEAAQEQPAGPTEPVESPPDVVPDGTAEAPATQPEATPPEQPEAPAPAFADGTRMRPDGTRGPEMVFVVGGALSIGADEAAVSRAQATCSGLAPDPGMCSGDAFVARTPAHEVVLAPYFIDVDEVSNADYQQCVAAGACRAPRYDICAVMLPEGEFSVVALPRKALAEFERNVSTANLPATCVTHKDAGDFCSWAGKRLPAEAEWEAAATSGGRHDYPWGDLFDATKANSADESLVKTMPAKAWKTPPIPVVKQDDRQAFAAPAETFAAGATEHGVRNLAGNVREWVREPFSSYPGGAKHPSDGLALARGGGWGDTGPFVDGRERHALEASARRTDLGFRCALDGAAPAPH